LIDYIDKLEVPKSTDNINFKKEYYEENSKKYGF
jgi:hypothetical protein